MNRGNVLAKSQVPRQDSSEVLVQAASEAHEQFERGLKRLLSLEHRCIRLLLGLHIHCTFDTLVHKLP